MGLHGGFQGEDHGIDPVVARAVPESTMQAGLLERGVTETILEGLRAAFEDNLLLVLGCACVVVLVFLAWQDA
jgi:hypothetical protein